MKKKLKNSKNLENIVNHIVAQHLVVKWDLLKRLLADHIKIVINNICFFQKSLLYFYYVKLYWW